MRNKLSLIIGTECLRVEDNKYYIANDELEVLERVSKYEFINEIKKFNWILNGWDDKLKEQYKKILDYIKGELK